MFEPGQDQASGLRQLLQSPPLRVLPVIGGGAGHTAAAVAEGIARAFARHGCRTLLVGAERPGWFGDEDEAWASGTGAGGAAATAAAVAAVRQVPLPPRFLGSGSAAGAAAWVEALPIAHRGYELAVLAAPEALLGPMLARLQPETLVLCGPLREDLAGAYALVKRLARGHGFGRFRLLFTGLADPALALRRQRRLAGVASRYLGVEVGFAGALGPDASPPDGGAGAMLADAGLRAQAGLLPVAQAARG
jgi:hypothetical protein